MDKNDTEGPVVGVCILNWNAGEALSACVRSVTQAVAGLRHEIVIVDNASSDGSLTQLAHHLPNLLIIKNATNVGYAKGNNIGARHLRALGCNRLLFVNPDVVVTCQTLRAMLKALDSDPAAGCVGGLAITNGHAVRSARNRPTRMDKLVAYGFLRRLPVLKRYYLRHFVPPSRGLFPVYAVSGACMLFRSEAFEAAGGFDEYTFLDEEELIMAERLKKTGWSTYFSGEALYRHSSSHRTARMRIVRRVHFIRSEQYLCRQYYKWSLAFRLFLLGLRVAELSCATAVWGLQRIAAALVHVLPRSRWGPGRDL